MERAFCKDFILTLNQIDVYPEYPVKEAVVVKRIANVWKNWKDDP